MLLRVTPDRNAVHIVKDLFSQDLNVWKEPNVPSVSQVRGKIVLIQSSTFHVGVAPGVTLIFHNRKPKEEQLPEHLRQAGKYCVDHLVVTDTSSTNLFDVPEKVAKKLNSVVGHHLEMLLKDSNRPPCLGVIAMDFPGPELIKTVSAFNLRGATKLR